MPYRTLTFRCTILLITLLAAGPLLATSIVGTTGSWQTFPATLNEDGTPYWDNQSKDGSQLNIGYYLSGTGGSFPQPSPGITPDWWGNSNGTADLGFYFNSLAPIPIALRLEVAGWSGTNQFGWYDTSNSAVLHPIFTGPDSPVMHSIFSPSNSFGFYLLAGSGQTFYTQSSNNTGGEGSTQHFAAFVESLSNSVYWIGVEDQTASERGKECLGDFNDLVIRMSAVAVPEPSTWTMLGLGLLLTVAARIRRRK